MAGVKIRTLPASAGMAWLRGGLRIFARQPIALLTLSAILLLIMLGPLLAPGVIYAVALLLFPMVVQCMLSMCRKADSGEAPNVLDCVAALRDATVRLRLLQIGIFYAIAVGLIGLGLMLLPEESGTPVREAPRVEQPKGAPPPAAEPASPPAGSSEAAPADGATGAPPAPAAAPQAAPATAREAPAEESVAGFPAARFLLALILVTPLHIIVVFATALVTWYELPSVKALFFGFFAGWRNKLPIVIALFGLFGLCLMIFLALVALIGALGLNQTTAEFLLGPVILLVLLPIGAGTYYSMVRDVVSSEDGAAPAEPAQA
jgi:hypothetical protein